MKKLFTLTLAGLAIGLCTLASAATLVDVPSGHWAEDAVTKLVNAGLVEGYPDGTFKGDRPLTRYEYAMIVARLMDKMDKTYCGKDMCGGTAAAPAAAAATCDCPASDITPEQLEEIKSIVKKLAAEFKDELAALKVKVDENSSRIDVLEKKVNTASVGKLQVKGSIRQRVDVPNTDLSNAMMAMSYNYMYNVAGVGASGLTAGYEMVPSLIFTGNAGEGVGFSIGLDKYIQNKATIGDRSTTTQELDIDHAYVDLDFSSSVRELDAVKVRSGYQKVSLGPYGMLVDNQGGESTPGVLMSVQKKIVSVAAFGGLIQTDTNGTYAADGIGSTGKDMYAAGRLGLNFSFADLGLNILGSGLQDEKGWSVDTVVPLLKDSSFLKEFRGEYMKITDLTTGASPAANADDASFVLGLDVYKSKRAGLTVSYGDIPASTVFTSLDASPFTEYDTACPLGLDVSGPNCVSFESGKMIFPAGFEGLGVEASYKVFGDVELGGKAVVGNFAGGTTTTLGDIDGKKYPGYGAVSVTKPINGDSKFRVEYMQQGRDPILLNRVRGELLISF